MTKLADAFVEIRPDTSGFSAELKGALAKAKESVDVVANLDSTTFKRALAALKADLKTISVAKATVQADVASASAKVKALKAELVGLNTKVKIEGGATPELLAKIEAVKADLASVSDTKANLDLDSAAANANLSALKARLAVFGATETGHKVNVEVDGQRGINFAFRGISSLTTAIVGMAPVAVPALAVVTAGVGALGSSLLAAGGAGGAFGLAVGGQVKAMKDAQANIKRITDLANKYAVGTKEHTMYQQELTNATNQFNKTFGPAAKGLDNVKNAWAGFLKASSPVTIKVMGDALNVVAGILPRLVPLANAAGRAVGGLVADLQGFVDGRQFQGILDFFRKNGPSAITSFGHIAGNVLLGVFNLFKAFAPFQKSFLGGFEGMSRSFADWARNLHKSDGFKSFIAYMAQVLPTVRDLFVNLTEFVGKFVVALGPLAGVELRVVTAFLGGLNSLPTGALTAIAVGITSIVLGLKAWELGTKAVVVVTKVWTGFQWLLNAALDANPIGITVIALAALAAAIVIAYKKSSTFREIVNAAFGDVKKVAGTVLDWLSKAVKDTVGAVTGAWGDLKSATSTTWNAIRGVITGSWNTIKGAVSTAVDTVKSTLSDAWDSIKSGASSAWSGIANAIGTAFSKVKGAVLAPIRYVVNNILAPLVEAFDTIASFVGIGSDKNPAIAVPHFASGGIFPGYTPGRDVGFAAVSGGEAIMRPEWTRAVGESTVHAMNKAARTGGTEGVRRYLGGYAAGGIVEPDARTTMDGEPLSKIAAAQVLLAEKLSNLNISVMQGGYQPESSYSGTSHEWPGVVDVGPADFFLQSLMRKVGFAAWARNIAGAASAGSGAHIHAVSLLDPGNYGASAFGVPGPQGQIAQFKAGGDGLGGSDYGPNPGMIAGLSSMLAQFGDIAGEITRFAGHTASYLPGFVTDPIGFLKDKVSGALDSPVLNSPLGKSLKEIPGKLISAMADFVKSHLPSISAGNLAPGGDAQLVAKTLMPQFGFGPDQFPPLQSLWQKESGWSYTATNPRGGDPATSAYGIPQALPGSKMAMTGADWVTNAQTQIQWGLGYIKERYGSPAAAWAHSQANNWYDQGGWLQSGGMAFNRSGSPEAVLNPAQSKALMSFANGGVVPGPTLAPAGVITPAITAAIAAWKAAAAALRHFGFGDNATASTIRGEVQSIVGALVGVFGKDSHIVKAVKATSDALVDVAKEREKVAAQLDRSQSKLASLILARRSLETQIAGGFNTTTYGLGAPTSASGLFMSARAEINDARHFKAVLQKLKAKGLAPNILKALALAGPTAIAQAEALASMSRAKLAQYQNLLQQGNQVENSLGAVVGSAIYNDDIKKQRLETHKLNEHLGRLNHRIDKLDEKIEHAVERALRKVHIDLDGKQVNRALADHEHRRNRVGA